MNTTCIILLEHLRDSTNTDAWERFYSMYAPLIISFAMKEGCTPQMAEDVLQETMICLNRCIKDFNHDGRKKGFRSFLLKITHARVCDAFRRRKRLVEMQPEQAEAEPDAGPPTDEKVGQIWENEWRHNLLEHAMLELKGQVELRTYESFRRYVIEGVPATEVADQLNLSINTVYQHRNRLIKMLQEIVQRLDSES